MEQINYWSENIEFEITGFSLISENEDDYNKFKKIKTTGCFQFNNKVLK